MTYLFLGEDKEAKDKKIAEIKNKTLSTQDSLNFDYEVLFSHKLDPVQLKKALVTLPVLSDKRLIVIRECHRFSAHNKKIILEFLKDKQETTVLILDSDKLTAGDSFVKSVSKNVRVVDFYGQVKSSVFDMTRAVGMRRDKEALKILDNLINEGDHPLQIMGALVWFWGKSKGRIPKARFQQGLTALQEADLNIKRSRLRPTHALELLVVKLCYLG